MICPLRRLIQKPEVILGPYVRPGMVVLDIGCAMGFFTLPMARLVGPDGKVVAVDVQERMLTVLRKRAAKAGLVDRITTRVCEAASLGLKEFDGGVDFVLAFAMVHEAPDAARLFADIHRALRPGGELLVAEPRGHVSASAFEETLAQAVQAGLAAVQRVKIAWSNAALLKKAGKQEE